MRLLGQRSWCQSGQAPKQGKLFKWDQVETNTSLNRIMMCNKCICYVWTSWKYYTTVCRTPRDWRAKVNINVSASIIELKKRQFFGWSMATAAVRSTSCLLGRWDNSRHLVPVISCSYHILLLSHAHYFLQIATQPLFNHFACCPFPVCARDAQPCRW